jgi:hypothetical protein
MANVNKPYGLRPMGNLSATGAQKQYGYEIADDQAGAIFQGAGTHASAVGVLNGVFYDDPSTGKPTWKNFYPGSVNVPAGKKILADVIDDPNQLFTIQATGQVSQSQIGKNAPPSTGTTGSITNGQSAMTLNSSLIANTGTLALKIVGYFNVPGNITSGEDYVQVVVKINTHQYGSAGVEGLGA